MDTENNILYDRTFIQSLTSEKIVEITKSIEMKPIYSSNIVSIGYNEALKIMRVIFKGGASYLYFNVEPNIYNTIAYAESKGKSLNENVIKNKNKYLYLKL